MAMTAKPCSMGAEQPRVVATAGSNVDSDTPLSIMRIKRLEGVNKELVERLKELTGECDELSAGLTAATQASGSRSCAADLPAIAYQDDIF